MLPPGTGLGKANCDGGAAPYKRAQAPSLWSEPKAPSLEPVGAPKVTSADSTRAAAGRLEDQAVTLLKWALVFFLISIVAGILGFTGLSAASADIARFLFYVFVVIFLLLLILGLTIFRV
jgi:uncharacterized membrane protein YtjA (UPF0391 family)